MTEETKVMENIRPIEEDIKLKSKQELIDALVILIDKSNTNKEIREYMREIYNEKDMVTRKVDSILKGKIILSTLTESELGVWCVYLFDITDDKTINPKLYFTDMKIEKIKQYYDIDSKNTRTDRIILKNVIKVKNQYLCPFISYYQIAKYMNNALINYNLDTQRDPITKKVKGALLKQPNINWTSVKEISEIIDRDEFTANLLTFNILKTSNFSQENVLYDEDEKTLTILQGVDVTDGFHRILSTIDSVSRAEESNRTLSYGFMVSITNFTVREAQDYISREDKRNPIDKNYSKSLEKNDYNLFVEALNNYGESSTNEMKNKIGNTLEEVKINNQYTTSNILHDSLKLTELQFDRPRRNEDYLEIFVQTFNRIIGDYMDKYDYNLDELKKNTIVLEPLAFVGYVSIVKELLDKDDRRQILKDMIKNGQINLDRNNPDWDTIDILKKNPKSLKKIFEYFKDIMIKNSNLKGGE